MRYILLFILLSQTIHLSAKSEDSLQLYVQEFNALYTQIRDGSIPADSAKLKFQIIISQIQRFFPDSLKGDSTAKLIFPLRTYNAQFIGGKEGNGYVSGTYNYFDGVKSIGHPAHDIFIRDKNQDCLDDNTWKAVDVLSVSTGLVIACETNWAADSALRGGLYIWIYNFEKKSFYYYAHNRKILVKAGDFVQKGQKIAEVGRTGKNAFKKRSPTHLHFAQMRLVDNLPIPRNPYLDLLNAVVKY